MFTDRRTMPDRTEDNKARETLDKQVEELVADTAAAAAVPIPHPPGEDAPAEFESAESVLAEAAGTLKPRPAANTPATPPEAAHAAAPRAAPTAPAEHADLPGPEDITKLDEKLAESAAELSAAGDAAGQVVDDSDIEAQISGAAAIPTPSAPTAHAEPAPAPIATAPAPVAPVTPAPPRPTKEPPAHAASAPAVHVEPKPKEPRRGLSGIAAAALQPLATFTLKLKPSTRQTIGYVAVVTLFQAACLWGFLMFKGPAGELEATSEPVILRKPGDPPAHHAPGKSGPDAHGSADSHVKPPVKKSAAKPKPAAKTESHAGAEHH